MGSYSLPHAPRNNAGVDRFLCDNFTYNGNRVVDSYICPGEWYGVIDNGHDRFVLVVLFWRERGELWVKPMSETAEPYYYNCPVSFLDKLTPPINDYSANWRRKVRENNGYVISPSVFGYTKAKKKAVEAKAKEYLIEAANEEYNNAFPDLVFDTFWVDIDGDSMSIDYRFDLANSRGWGDEGFIEVSLWRYGMNGTDSVDELARSVCGFVWDEIKPILDEIKGLKSNSIRSHRR